MKPLYKIVERKSCSSLRKVVPLLSDSITYLVSVAIFPIYTKIMLRTVFLGFSCIWKMTVLKYTEALSATILRDFVCNLRKEVQT